jgi:hypothetical protein
MAAHKNRNTETVVMAIARLENLRVPAFVGKVVGWPVGWPVGCPEGLLVGCDEGCIVGCIVGVDDG